MLQKKNKKKESDEETLRDVEREMAKPRIAKSARRACAVDRSGRIPEATRLGADDISTRRFKPADIPGGPHLSSAGVRRFRMIVAISSWHKPLHGPLQAKGLSVAAAGIPRKDADYIVVTCPECLRSSTLPDSNATGHLQEADCIACGAKIQYLVDSSILKLLDEKSKRLPAI